MSDPVKTSAAKKKKTPRKGERDPLSGSVINRMSRGFFTHGRMRWLILLFLSLIVSIALFPSILTKAQTYKVGDVAERDIKASKDFLIENKQLTEKNREKALKEVLSVYDFDRTSSHLATSIKEAFIIGRELKDQFFVTPSEGEISPGDDTQTPPETEEKYQEILSRFFSTLEIPLDEAIFERLLASGFSSPVETLLIRLTRDVANKGIVGNFPMLQKDMERGGITLHEINSKEEVTAKDPSLFFDLKGAKDHIAERASSLGGAKATPELTETAVELARLLIKPNLNYNQRETELRKEQAQASVNPVYFKVKKGEMLVREGERIGPEHLLKLSAETSSQERVDMVGRVPAMTLLIGTLFLVIYFTGAASYLGDPKDIPFNAVALLTLFVFAWAFNFIAEEVARGFTYFSSTALLFALPAACGSMVISIFLGVGVATAFSLLTSVLVALISGGRVELFIYFFIGSLLAAYGVRNCTERGILIKTGLMVGLINMILSLAIEMLYGTFYSVESLIAAAAGFTGGILSGVIATGILPLVEMSFGYTSDIKLLELANLDQPLLRELMVRAPGTYHHSVITSNMVEATAKAVKANPLLAKVSAYYHDIGKIKKPLYFIENQMGCENRHEKLAPSMSSLILISHVKDGVELAREHKLGREIIDIIQQHHGSSLISFFYHKARDRMLAKGNKSVTIKEEDFRYPGPKPQTKEAGLVMLADMVEAASRSLVDPTPARIQGIVQKIINSAFSDGQLNECELTLKDLNAIAKSFNKTLSGIFHHRVEYPEAAVKAPKKAKNGYTDQLPKEDSGTKKSDDKTELDEGLKRLGLS